MFEIRRLITGIIYIVAIFMILILGARFILELTNQPDASQLITDLSNSLLRPFGGMFAISYLANVIIYAEIIFAAIFYVIFATLIDKIFTSPFHPDIRVALIDILSALFRIAEYILFFRLILNLFTVNKAAPFANFIYDITDPIILPLNAVIPVVRVIFFDLEFAVLALLLVLLFIDYYIEHLLKYSVFGEVAEEYEQDSVVYKVRKIIVGEPKTVLRMEKTY